MILLQAFGTFMIVFVFVAAFLYSAWYWDEIWNKLKLWTEVIVDHPMLAAWFWSRWNKDTRARYQLFREARGFNPKLAKSYNPFDKPAPVVHTSFHENALSCTDDCKRYLIDRDGRPLHMPLPPPEIVPDAIVTIESNKPLDAAGYLDTKIRWLRNQRQLTVQAMVGLMDKIEEYPKKFVGRIPPLYYADWDILEERVRRYDDQIEVEQAKRDNLEAAGRSASTAIYAPGSAAPVLHAAGEDAIERYNRLVRESGALRIERDGGFRGVDY